MTQQATVIRPIRIPVPIKTVHVALASNGKGNGDIENIALRLTSEEYSFIKASSNTKQTRFTTEEYDSFLTNLNKRHSILRSALKRTGIKGRHIIVQAIERLD